MALPVAADLATLHTLDRRLLYIFVTGPGRGEGLALALPGGGWYLMDGCSTTDGRHGDNLPLQKILERWRSSSPTQPDLLRGLMISHPHDDHVDGIPDIINAFAPEHIAVSGSRTPGPDLLSEYRRRRAALRRTSATRTSPRQNRVLKALDAIDTWVGSHPERLVSAYDGKVIPLKPAPVNLLVRAPDPDLCSDFLIGPSRRASSNANHISTVVEVVFGTTRLVLGGDLPYLGRKGGPAVPSGWQLVMTRHPHLAEHLGLKIPHHGSQEAIHPDLIGRKSGNRAWSVTPFNSHDLPRMEDRQGLDTLLRANNSVLLTAVPASRALQATLPVPAQVTLAVLKVRVPKQKKNISFLEGAIPIQPGTAVGPLDPIWCLAFDDSGHIMGRWRGRAALEVTS